MIYGQLTPILLDNNLQDGPTTDTTEQNSPTGGFVINSLSIRSDYF